MHKTIISLVLLLLPLLACNLSRTPPTPTAPPATAPQATSIAPTLFASITPLPGGGGSIVATTPPSGTTCTPPAGWVPYTIEAGDSLGALAQDTGTTMQDVINANCLSDPDTLFTGQVIYLPTQPVSG